MSAQDGTILLDEIGETSAAFQVRMLRVLEEHEVQQLGSSVRQKTNARVIAATNQNLSDLVESGEFRRDLFYRINIMTVVLPPLRERMEDVPLLVDHFIRKMNRRKGKRIIGITPDAMSMVLNHDYPGNIRELENIIEHAFILCSEEMIQPHHLPVYLKNVREESQNDS